LAIERLVVIGVMEQPNPRSGVEFLVPQDMYGDYKLWGSRKCPHEDHGVGIRVMDGT